MREHGWEHKQMTRGRGVSSLLLCCLLLLAPHLGSSYRTSYTRAGKLVAVRSADGASPTTFCSDIPSGEDGGGGIAGRLPVAHRLNPCSPYAGAKSQGEPSESAADVLRRDALGLRSLYGDSGSASDVTIPSTGSPLVAYPGASEYHVVVGYGTPLQRLAVGFDTASSGVSLLACKPCAAAGASCNKAFDQSRSSTLAQIPCNSLDCPLSACSGPSCTFSVSKNDTVVLNGTVVTDTLALSGSTTMQGFRFACLETGYAGSSRTVDDTPSGVLDLSRDIHSLASRAPFSPDTVAFSYCLPSDTTSHGFLSIAAARPELSGRFVSYATLRTSPARPNLYLVQLTAISVGGKDIPVPPTICSFARGRI